jgi:hypothetical protein
MIERRTAEKPTGDIASVELHDAKVSSIVVGANEPLVIQFKHFPVYHQRDATHLELWSYSASLELYGVDHMVVSGASGPRDYVSDAVAYKSEGIVEWETLLAKTFISRVEFTYGSGRTIQIACREAHLVLLEPLRYVEDWVEASSPTPPLL